MKKIPRSLVVVGLALLGFYALASVMLYIKQEEIVYQVHPANRQISNTPKSIGLDYEEVTLTTVDQVRLHAWYVPAPQARATVLYLHGNASNISHWLDTLAMLHAMQLNTLIFDYRGFGQSEGEHSEVGTYHDAEAAWNFLRTQKKLRSEQIIVYGRSLGGGIATYLASKYQPGLVILESTFTSVPDLGRERYPWLPVRWLARINYDSLQRISRNQSPLLIMHSPQDNVISYHHGQQLFANAVSVKQWMELQGGHDGYQLTKNYTATLARFIQQYLPAP